MRTPGLLIRAHSNDLVHNLITSAKTLSPSVREFGEGLGLQRGLPWWLSGKESACQRRRRRFDPWVGKIPWRRKWQPTPVFSPGESHGLRSLKGYSPWGHKDWDTTEQLSMHVNMCIPRIKDMQNSEFITPLRKYSKSHVSQLS